MRSRSGRYPLVHLAIWATLGYSFLYVQAALPPKSRDAKFTKKLPVTLQDVLTGALGAAGFGGAWVPGSDDTLSVTTGNTVFEYNVTGTGNRTIVSDADFEEQYDGQGLGFTFSANRKFILIEHSRRTLWRHSYLAKCDIYDIANKTFTPLVPVGLHEHASTELQLVSWSPTGNSLVFIYENNIYYKPGPTKEDVVVQITSDGSSIHDPEVAIYNGISDWVYEEEMFGSSVAMWFSKDGSHLAYVRFDDTRVETFAWPLYGEPGVRDTVYPIYQPIRYPKAGRENPIVSLHVVNLTAPTQIKEVKYPPHQVEKGLQYYIASVTWVSNTTLIMENLNRAQNQSSWNLCSAITGVCTEIYSYAQTQPVGWVDAHTPTVSQDGSRFLTLQPVRQNVAPSRSYTHIVSVMTNSTQGNTNFTEITSGALNIDSVVGWDEANDKIYFSATGFHPGSVKSDPSERHVYYVWSNGTNTVPVCMTCNLKNNAEEDCRSNSVTFSANYKLYIHACRGPGVPEISTKRTSTHEVVRMWVDNNKLRNRLESKAMPINLEFEVPIAGGFMAKVRLYLPPDFDPSKKYPLLIDVYAGPDSQKITQEYKFDWGTYLPSAKGIIFGSIDGRGSGRQSAEQKFSVYRDLGTAEVQDQIGVTKYLVENKSYIDPNKTAIWGWSYGGYATTMALGTDSENVFKCGIAVAPVSNWLYYDTIYTERYMGEPSDEDNWAGYNASSVMNHLEHIRSKQLLIIHGNADDNVHYQHSMMLARALEQSDIMFTQLSYPEENHGIGGRGMRQHLYHSMERFLTRECGFGQETFSENSGKSTGSSFATSFYSILLCFITFFVTSIRL